MKRLLMFLKDLPGKILGNLKKKWDDETGPKKKEKEVKDKITEIPVVDAAGNPVMEVKRKGRKHGFWKRVGIFLLAIISVLVFQWLILLFSASAIFRIVFVGVVAWFILYRRKQYRRRDWVTVIGFLMLIGLSIAYLPDFKATLRNAANWFIGIAFLVFIAEELFNTNWYPKSVGLVGIMVVLVVLVSALYDVVRPHEYYATEGPRAKISVADKQQEISNWERLKAKVSPANIAPGTYRQIPSNLSGIPSDTPGVVEDITILTMRNHLPAEYGRLEAVISKLFFIAYFLMVGLAFAPIASWEIFQDALKKSKEKRAKEKGQPVNRFVIEVVAEFVREFFAGHAVGGVFKKK